MRCGAEITDFQAKRFNNTCPECIRLGMIRQTVSQSSKSGQVGTAAFFALLAFGGVMGLFIGLIRDIGPLWMMASLLWMVGNSILAFLLYPRS